MRLRFGEKGMTATEAQKQANIDETSRRNVPGLRS